MRIALCGPSGSGKTTLATTLSVILKKQDRLICYSRPTRVARSMGYESARDVPTDYHSQIIFQTLCLSEQVKAESKFGNDFIIDRSTIDPLAYLEYKMPYMKGTMEHTVYSKMAVSLCEYDYLFYVPNFSEDIEDNGIRFTKDQDLVGKCFLNIFDTYKIRYHYIKQKNLVDRAREIEEVLNSNDIR